MRINDLDNVELYEIYMIKNLKNNKVYIGATSQGSAKRFKQHLWKATSGSNYALHQAIREDGENNFEVSTLEYVYTIEDLKKQEKYWIIMSRANNPKYGYNGDCGGDIMFHTEDAKAKISAVHKGKDMSKFYHAVLQYDNDGNFMQEFPSVTHAVEHTGISKASLVRGLHHTFKTKSRVNPYIWLYKEDYPEIPKKINPEHFAKYLQIAKRVPEEFIEAGKKYRFGQTDFTCKPVAQYDKYHNRIAVYSSVNIASSKTGISSRTIRDYCNKKFESKMLDKNFLERITYTWEYITDVESLTDSEKTDLKTQTENIVLTKGVVSPVNLVDKNNNIIKTYASISEVAREINIDPSWLRKQLKQNGYRVVGENKLKMC